jgi:DHA1 family tetracycline resistance protein-like MFS transporter
VESFGVSSFVVTLLFSAFALFSFVSGPFLGALSDKIGRRPVLILSIASTAIGWFVFASAHAVWVLFLGRIIDGMAAGNFPIAQSYLVDIAKNDKERTTILGLIGAVFGIGFIIGPAIGGSLGAISPSLPFWFVGALATLNVVGAYFFLPETHNNREKMQKKIPMNPLIPLAAALKDKVLRGRYAAWFLFGVAFAGMQSIFALFVKVVFGFSATATGYIFTGMGVVLVINQAFALKKIWLKYFKESDLEVWFFMIMSLGFVFIDLKFLPLFVLGIFLTTLGQSTLRVVMSSGVAGVAGHARRGEVMGIMASIMSASMIVGPLMAGALFEKNIQWPFLVNVILLVVAFIIVKRSHDGQKITEEVDVPVVA